MVISMMEDDHLNAHTFTSLGWQAAKLVRRLKVQQPQKKGRTPKRPQSPRREGRNSAGEEGEKARYPPSVRPLACKHGNALRVVGLVAEHGRKVRERSADSLGGHGQFALREML